MLIIRVVYFSATTSLLLPYQLLLIHAKSNSAYPLFSFYNRFCCNSTYSSISMRNSHGVYAAVLTCTVLQYNEHLKVNYKTNPSLCS